MNLKERRVFEFTLFLIVSPGPIFYVMFWRLQQI